MISIADLAMNYGKKTLFEKSSVTFNPGKSYGLVGANGSGKSTLLRLIAGEEKPNSGTISVPRDLKLGVLRQDHFQYENIKVIDVVLLGKPALCEALREKEKILESENLDSQSGHRLGQLEEMIAELELREKDLGKRLADPKVFKDTKKSVPLINEYNDVKEKLESSLLKWEYCQGQLETAGRDL